MLSHRLRALALPVVLGVAICALNVLAPVVAHAQFGSFWISTDRSQYQAGDIAQICYGVPGPGPIVITDDHMAGGQQVLLAGMDNGVGGCISRPISAPAGLACVRIASAYASGPAPAQACFQVAVQGPLVGACGSISVLNGHVTTAGAVAAESCFYQAYQLCTPATLNATMAGIDSGTRHMFSLQRGILGSCVIADAVQPYVSPLGPGAITNTTCAALTALPTGLLFSSCGSLGNVFVPQV